MHDTPVRHLGVTVLPEYVQSEGSAAVIDTLQHRLRATSVTTSPYVARAAAAGTGSREPPADAGAGTGRLLDRPLWGRSEVWMETAPSFVPAAALYAGSPYPPAEVSGLTHAEGARVGEFLSAAKRRGLTAWLQVMAAMPPGLRVQFGGASPEDRPLMADGRPVPDRVDANATLASPGLRRYMRGLIRDLHAAYPQADGLKFDWPEYPPYHFQSLLADYNPQVAPYAAEIGLDLGRLAGEMTRSCPQTGFGQSVRDGATLAEAMADLERRVPATADHFRLRRHLTTSYARFLREEVDAASNGTWRVYLQGFPPPWNRLSGFDPGALAPHADRIGVKFYTMHWPMIGANHVAHATDLFGVDRDTATAWFRAQFIGDRSGSTEPLAYPDPDTGHGVPASAFSEKWQDLDFPEAVGIAHSYGPIDDVVMRFEALFRATGGQVDINRYAYLSEPKITALSEALARLTGAPSPRLPHF